ncbi:MAG: winged helix-turn-helix domain-containing protein [Candidatus Bathyarchaeota archaeon]|nr:winged helix-turn-helix domain-containing protein [Candidatus Bathyarchaeota archaeon]
MELEEVLSSKPRIKIIKLIAQVGALNVSGIARRLNLNYASTSAHLKLLEAEGILTQKSYGRIRIYKLDENSPKAKAVRNLIETWEQNK